MEVASVKDSMAKKALVPLALRKEISSLALSQQGTSDLHTSSVNDMTRVFESGVNCLRSVKKLPVSRVNFP